MQASAVSSAANLDVTRAELTDTEAGSGTTRFNGQGYQLRASYVHPLTPATSVVPYVGLRYTRVSAGAYTENTTDEVTAPLSYSAMTQNTLSAIGGVGVKSLLAEKLTGTASVGLQHNLDYDMDDYRGTSDITDLETFSVGMSAGKRSSMLTASAGLSYDLSKKERLSFNVLWQQQPFDNTATTTALATYSVGF